MESLEKSFLRPRNSLGRFALRMPPHNATLKRKNAQDPVTERPSKKEGKTKAKPQSKGPSREKNLPMIAGKASACGSWRVPSTVLEDGHDSNGKAAVPSFNTCRPRPTCTTRWACECTHVDGSAASAIQSFKTQGHSTGASVRCRKEHYKLFK